jgi:hypothetical protein
MRRVYLILGIILAAVVLIQLIRPEKNLGEADSPDDFLQVSAVPDTLARIFLNSCYNCHSDQTNYPWYGSIAPFSWIMSGHIREGKSHLNFSVWGTLDRAQKISRLEGICSECSEGMMPLKSYLMIHRSATLGPREIEAICEWSEEESRSIMGAQAP